MKTRKKWWAGTAVLALASVVTSLLLVGSGSATVPSAALDCTAGGKISGAGATFATNLWAAPTASFIKGFKDDVCGPGTDPATYNYTGAVTGSGGGQMSMSCRHDAWAGSDIPYDNATLLNISGPTGQLIVSGLNCAATYPANSTSGVQPTATPFPAAADTPAKMMAFPVAAGAVVVAANLAGSTCSGPLQLTGVMVSRLFGGDITNWNDPALRANGLNAGLGGGCNLLVKRAVRFDKSGTTQVHKNYLVAVDNTRATSTTCDVGTQWSFYAQDANNQSWPSGAGCSPLINSGANGGGSLVTFCNNAAQVGAICYADLKDVPASFANLTRSSLLAGVGGLYVPPNSGTASNCDASFVTTPSGGVGLSYDTSTDPTTWDTWASDNVQNGGNHGNFSNLGSKYPNCGVTFAMVFSGLSGGQGPGVDPVSRLTAAQRRTLYSFMLYVLSSAGQSTANVGAGGYTPLPSGIVTTLRNGFKSGTNY